MLYVGRSTDRRVSRTVALALSAFMAAAALVAIGVGTANAAGSCSTGFDINFTSAYGHGRYTTGVCTVKSYIAGGGVHLVAAPNDPAHVVTILKGTSPTFSQNFICGVVLGGHGWLATEYSKNSYGWIDATLHIGQTTGTNTPGVQPCGKPGVRPHAQPQAPLPTGGSGSGAIAVRTGLNHVGDGYRFGANGPGVWDCSSFTQMAWKSAGVNLPRTSGAQYGAIRHISKNELQPGDLLFYYSPIGHVAMYTGNGKVVEASTPQQGVSTRNVYWSGFVGAGRPG